MLLRKGGVMSKYLFCGNYTAEGLKGLLSMGAAKRRDMVADTVKSLGGALESFHLAFGDTDVFVIADLPGDKEAAALAMTVSTAGGVSLRTVKLLTPDEVDAAKQVSVDLRPLVS